MHRSQTRMRDASCCTDVAAGDASAVQRGALLWPARPAVPCNPLFEFDCETAGRRAPAGR